jgi:hypothetical protein
MKLAFSGLISLLFLSAFAYGQVRTLSGTVTSSADHQPIKGASVTIKNTSEGTTTDEHGRFFLRTSRAGGTLVVSFIGMQEVEAPITASDVYHFSLEPRSSSLGEVVVTALGVTREKKALGYSVQKLQGDQLNVARDENILNSLYGKVAGVQITSGGSALGSSSRITIRGNSSFGNNTPLFIVDGTPINNSSTNLDGAGGG